MTIRAALIDMDGTIYDSGMDWRAIRREIGIEQDGHPILKQLEDASHEVRERGLSILLRAERQGAETGRLVPGAGEMVSWLRGQGVRCALITNNSRRSADIVLGKHPLPFDLVLTRDDGAAKPHPGVLVEALRRLEIAPGEAAAIGDAHLDIIAAHGARIPRILSVGMPSWMEEHIPPDVVYTPVADLSEARRVLAAWIAG